MWRRRSSPAWRSRREAGYTLTEVIVALVLGSTVAVAAVGGYIFASGSWQEQRQRLETQQNLRAAIDLLSRELRLAGACLPTAGPTNIRPLTGVDNGTTDTFTVRANVRCAIGSLTGDVGAGATVLTLDTVAEFVAGMSVYVLHADTTTGEYAQVDSVDQGANRLTLQTPLTRGYPKDSSVYGAEAQTFAIGSVGTAPVLTVATALGSPQPAIEGIERLDVRYVLNRNCSPGPCDVVDLPTSDSEWSLVRAVQLDIGARSLRPITGGFYRLSQSIEVKPRNFLF